MEPAERLDLEPPKLWSALWGGLGRAVHDRRHPYRLPVVATRCPKRGIRARTVVLRASSPAPASLTLYSDRRAGKLAGLALDPRVSWCFYDPRRRVQVRVETRAVIHVDDAEARAAWERQGAAARRLYRATPEPGSRLPAAWRLPAADAGDAGFENFAVIECAVEEVEWLRLDGERHHRVRFRPDPDGRWQGEALVP